MEIVFVIFQFHYRNRQQELMDHKREICCWNNDYLLYLTNLKRGRYNPSVTQREKVNGWESDVEFTWRKFTAALWIRNNVTGSQDKIIKCAVLSDNKGGPCYRLVPGCDHWDGVWGAGYMSGIHRCEWKGKIQDWAAEKPSCPAGLTAQRGLWGMSAHVLGPVPDVEGPRWGWLPSAEADIDVCWRGGCFLTTHPTQASEPVRPWSGTWVPISVYRGLPPECQGLSAVVSL